MLAAALLTMMCAGCASSGAGKVEPVRLPPAPACLAEVPVPLVNVGDDARLALARSRAALASANGNLRCGRAWYDALARVYAPPSQ
jgi:hypothetical protein